MLIYRLIYAAEIGELPTSGAFGAIQMGLKRRKPVKTLKIAAICVKLRVYGET